MSKTKWYAKPIYVIVALAMVLSFGLVASDASAAGTSVGLSLAQPAGSTVTWVTSPTAHDGNYSASFVLVGSVADGSTHVQFCPTAQGVTLSDLQADITANAQGFSFWHQEGGTTQTNWAQFELRFEEPGAGTGWFEITAVGLQNYTGQTSWNQQKLVAATPAGYGGNTPNGSSVFDWSLANDLTTIQAGMDALFEAAQTGSGAATANYVLERVRVELWEGATARTCYIDDVAIDGATYAIEPLTLDATLVSGVSYYKTGDTVTMTLCNSNVTGTTPAYFVYSTTVALGGKITIALSETGAGTGVFTGSFNLVSTTPGTGELLVNNGDDILVESASDWGAGTQTLVYADPPDGKVDDTAPTITVVSPTGYTTDTTPKIKANFTEAASGVDTTTIVMTLDGGAVTPDVATTATVEYTPGTAIAEGSHTVTVDVSDVAGNPATQASWSFTVDTIAPVITLQVATPATVKPAASGGVDPVFSATITDATSGVDPATVTLNLTTLAPSGGTQTMVYDGLGTDNYVYTLTNNLTTEQTKTDLHVNASDLAGNSATTADITLNVSSDIIPPVIASPAITYDYDTSARPADTVEIKATVTDANTVTVTATCAGLNPITPITLAQVGATDVYEKTDCAVGSVATGSYDITITATDAKGNVATDATSLDLVVDPDAYGAVISLYTGWNLISLPLIPGNTDIATVLTGVSVPGNVTMVYYWYNDGTTTAWQTFTPGAGGTLTTMEDGKAYWMYMSGADTLTMTGRTMPAPPGVPPIYAVYGGWNFVGFKSLITQVNTAYLVNLGTNYSVVYGYKTVGGYSLIQPGGGNMETGYGYWLWLTTSSGTIVPP